MMRIITGKARGIRLDTLDGDETRPTAERVKEAVFSMLQFDIEGRRVLDLFSGSGQMALEALSRGADSAVMVDKSKNALKIIEKNADKTKLSDKCEIRNSDALDYIKRCREDRFDIVFLDPPYAAGIVPTVLEKIMPNLKDTSVVICETGNDILDSIPPQYEVVKNVKYGIAYVTVLRFNGGN